MHPPPGYQQSPNKFYKLHWALYDLKQAPRAWFVKCSSIIMDFSFTSNPHDSALFLYKMDQGTFSPPLYV